MTTQFILDYQLLMIRREKFICLISLFAQYTMIDVVILALLAISHQRYQQLSKPYRVSESLGQPGNLIKLFVSSMSAPFVWTLLFVFYTLSGKLDFENCSIGHSLIFSLIKTVALGILPLLLIVYLNVKSVLILRAKKRNLKKILDLKKRSSSSAVLLGTHANNNGQLVRDAHVNFTSHLIIKLLRLARIKNNHANNNNKRDTKLLIFLLGITMNLFLTQSIFLITWPLYILYPNMYILNELYHHGVWISYTHSLTNPILFIGFNETIKARFKRLFRFFKS
jgi:hypothetical protein